MAIEQGFSDSWGSVKRVSHAGFLTAAACVPQLQAYVSIRPRLALATDVVVTSELPMADTASVCGAAGRG